MGRKILAVVVALITAWAIFLIVEMVSTRFWNTPNNLEYMGRGEVASYFASLPPIAYAIVLFGYIIGAFFAGFIVTKMSRRESPGLALPILVGIILTLGAVANAMMLPGQPVWFILAGLVVFLPMALLAHRFAR